MVPDESWEWGERLVSGEKSVLENRLVVECVKGEQGRWWRFTYASVGLRALELAGKDGGGGAEGGFELAGRVERMDGCDRLSPERDLEDGCKRSECGRELHVGQLCLWLRKEGMK